MVKCPFCGEEVPAEEYFSHLARTQHLKGAREVKKMPGEEPLSSGLYTFKCPKCGRVTPKILVLGEPPREYAPQCPVCGGRMIREEKPVAVREATFEDLHMSTVFDAMNVAYNTFVEEPPRVLHEENIPRFIKFSNDLFRAQGLHGVDVEKFRTEFKDQLDYYLKEVERLREKR
jgi:predicted RNA-binding Zn-ribbon protein involved in translation (DUF1610 family)